MTAVQKQNAIHWCTTNNPDGISWQAPLWSTSSEGKLIFWSDSKSSMAKFSMARSWMTSSQRLPSQLASVHCIFKESAIDSHNQVQLYRQLYCYPCFDQGTYWSAWSSWHLWLVLSSPQQLLNCSTWLTKWVSSMESKDYALNSKNCSPSLKFVTSICCFYLVHKHIIASRLRLEIQEKTLTCNKNYHEEFTSVAQHLCMHITLGCS